jgi:hypothetical protein
LNDLANSIEIPGSVSSSDGTNEFNFNNKGNNEINNFSGIENEDY